jgi:ABC-type anion transport system duplicated permease subunit
MLRRATCLWQMTVQCYCLQLSICRASLILCKFLTGVCHSVADDFWFVTRSEVYSVDRVNLHLD